MTGETTRFTIEVNTVAAPDVLGALGKFALDRGITLSIIVDPTAEFQETAPEEEGPAYDPTKVDYVEDIQTGKKIAIITRERLTNYQWIKRNMSHDGTTFGSRIFNLAAQERRTGKSMGLEAYFWIDPRGRPAGILADKAPELAKNLPRMELSYIGPIGMQTFKDYCEELFVESESAKP